MVGRWWSGAEVSPGPVHSGPGMPFTDTTTKYFGIFDDDQADIYDLDFVSGVSVWFLHGDVFVDMVENGDDGIGMGVGDIFDVKFPLCKWLRSDVSIGVENIL